MIAKQIHADEKESKVGETLKSFRVPLNSLFSCVPGSWNINFLMVFWIGWVQLFVNGCLTISIHLNKLFGVPGLGCLGSSPPARWGLKHRFYNEKLMPLPLPTFLLEASDLMCIAFMESKWPLFKKVGAPQNNAFSNQKKLHLGSMFVWGGKDTEGQGYADAFTFVSYLFLYLHIDQRRRAIFRKAPQTHIVFRE